MRINGHPAHDPHGAGLRHAGKARGGAGEVAAAASALAPAPAPTGPTAATAGTDTAAPPESTVEMAARKAPPGLLRVAARLEAMGAEARSGGQSNALTQITRNLQRYMDHQGLTPAAVPAPAPAPAPEATEPAASTDASASASTVEATGIGLSA